jgi:hypothetical protein
MGKTIVIIAGGFHPYHAGHHALYQSAQRTFPDAEVYVAATNDTSSRPFPFAVKEKLARLAGVETGHFVQVKSPFRAEEITAKFDPQKDVLIFVRSEKDANTPPQAGGVKKDGSPSYLQPLLDAKRLEPFSKHAYMAYLPTVEFGPGMTSATQIRSAWPGLDERRKTALVMSLYPKTQSNTKLAATVVKLLDTAIGSEQGVAEGSLNEFAVDDFGDSGDHRSKLLASVGRLFDAGNKVDWQVPGQMGHVTRVQDDGITMKKWKMPHSRMSFFLPMRDDSRDSRYTIKMVGPKHYAVVSADQGMAENQGWAATFTNEETRAYGGQQGAGITAAYQRRENQPVDERKQDSKDMPAAYRRDPELYKLRQYAKQHYSQYADDPEMAMMKLLQRGMEHSEINDQQHDRKLAALAREIQSVRSELRQQQNEDYLEEKWSEKYKSSINCAAPQGFSQRAHCAGRKK